MQKLLGIVIAAGVAAAAWTFLQSFDIKGLDQVKVVPRDEISSEPLAARGSNETIRLASFNIQVLGPTKASKSEVMHMLGKILRQFDVVAIQEIRTTDRNVMYELLDAVNSAGDKYDFVIGPRVGRTSSKEQFAYLFDTQRIEVDRYQLYTVQDPHDVIHREPLVGWFRVRTAEPESSFTFTLVNVHTDPDEAEDEVAALHSLFDEVRNDGRQEDDVIMLGDFNADRDEILQLGSGTITAVISKMTNTRGSKQYDNILLDERATVEFSGRSGVYDFLREFNLSLEDALKVSDHLPVWAEFQSVEGGPTRRVARGDNRTPQ